MARVVRQVEQETQARLGFLAAQGRQVTVDHLERLELLVNQGGEDLPGQLGLGVKMEIQEAEVRMDLWDLQDKLDSLGVMASQEHQVRKDHRDNLAVQAVQDR
jgi:hypothetical protein